MRKDSLLKVLLIHPPWLRFFGSCLAAPPIALNFLAAYVKKYTPEVDIEVYNADYFSGAVPSIANDLFTSKHHEYCKRVKDKNDPVWSDIRKVISDFQPDVVGISSMTASFPAAISVATIVKEINPNIKVVMGGRHPSSLPELTLSEKNVDYVVIGEGEEAFCEFLQNINDVSQVSGIGYKDSNGKLVFTQTRMARSQINELPFPIFDSNISKYGHENKKNPEIYTWSLLSARGCPFQCVYCATDKIVRFRDVENVRQEIQEIKRRYGITEFCFEDDSFSLKRSRMEDMCRMLAEENVRWHCNTRVDLLDEAMVVLMKNSGCSQVYIGVETGSPNTLKRIKKKISIPQVKKALLLLKKYNLMVAGFFIIGFYWESYRDMKQTVNLIKELPLDTFQINIATPLPGTALFQDLVALGKLKPEEIDWTKFHQGSYYMNFSSYSQDQWEKMLAKLQQQAFHLLRKKFFWLTLRKFIKNPKAIIKKIITRIYKNPKLLTWFLPSKS